MKKVVLLVVLLAVISTVKSQVPGYLGLIYDNEIPLLTVRPYLYIPVAVEKKKNTDYNTVVGFGQNSLGNLSISLGFEARKKLNGKLRAVAGFSVEILGWGDVYKEFMPNYRVGIEAGKVTILGVSNWKFRKVKVAGVDMVEPVFSPSVGIFYLVR